MLYTALLEQYVLFISADQTGESSGGPSDAGHLHVKDKQNPHIRILSPFRSDL